MSEPGFGVYIHWPYCTAICPYCDFNVYRRRGNDHETLLSAITTDIAAHSRRFSLPAVETVFFGGGTPSLLSGREIETLLASIDHAFGLAPGAEITLEANPEDAHTFKDQAAAGVSRFSLGLQALRDGDLKRLGRLHDASAGLRAVDAAAATGRRVSVDLIYAREGQTEADWRAELGEALSLPVEHFSLYQLTIEPGTAFERAVSRGRLTPPDAELSARLFEATQDLCAAAGAPAYEISNHARGKRAQSVHNRLYWTGGTFLGAGPGAHGRLIGAEGTRLATRAAPRPHDYVRATAEGGVGWGSAVVLTGEEAGDELLLMGLRLEDGVDLARVARFWGRPVPERAIDRLVEQGLVWRRGERVGLHQSGRLVADRVAFEIASAA